MVTRRAHRDERIRVGAGHHRIGCRHRAADAAHDSFPGARRHRGVAVDIDHAALRGDVPELADIMLAMAQRDGIQIAFRRLAARERFEAIFGHNLSHGAQPVGTLGVSRRRDMV
jgi:hypothetical protein